MYKLTEDEYKNCKFMLKLLNKVATDKYLWRVNMFSAKMETLKEPNDDALSVAKFLHDKFYSNRHDIAELLEKVSGRNDYVEALDRYDDLLECAEEDVIERFPLTPFLILKINNKKSEPEKRIIAYETDHTFLTVSKGGYKRNQSKGDIYQYMEEGGKYNEYYEVSENIGANELFIDALPKSVFEKQLSQVIAIYYTYVPK